jgi:sporulation protein YlmC with PRC-barrel domain
MSNKIGRSEYTKAINCRDVEPSALTKFINAAPNIFDHMTYLYVSFAQAANILHLFGKSVFTVETTEIGRVQNTNPEVSIKKGDTEMRIVQMTGNGSTGEYTSDHIDLKKLRSKGTLLYEDSLVNNNLFLRILNAKKTINVSFDSNRLPIPFPKKVDDSVLGDLSEHYSQAIIEAGKEQKKPFGNDAIDVGQENEPKVVEGIGGKTKKSRKIKRKGKRITKKKKKLFKKTRQKYKKQK